MTTRAKVRALAKKLGVTIEGEWNLCAPDGYRFAGTGTHVCVFEPQIPFDEFIPGSRNNRRPNKAEIELAWESALSDLTYGLEQCPPDCECRDEEGK